MVATIWSRGIAENRALTVALPVSATKRFNCFLSHAHREAIAQGKPRRIEPVGRIHADAAEIRRSEM